MTPENARIGARLKAAREARGWTQRELAMKVADHLGEELTTNRSTLVEYVKRWERGRAGVSLPNQRALAAALGIPRQQLFDLTNDVEDPVQRREFLGVTAGLAVAPWAASPPDPTRKIGADDVEQLRRRTARLRRLDDILGGRDTYPVYASELSRTRGLLDSATYSETTGRALLTVLAEQAQQAGWAAMDAGRMDAAQTHYSDSMTAASKAGSTALIGNALALMSYQRTATGQAGTEEADAACRVVNPSTPPAVRALLYERAAWAHAMAGPSHTRQVEDALHEARAALTMDGHHDPDWARWVDDVELQVMTGRCWAILRRPDRAVPALEWAMARFDEAHARDASLYLSWLADAHLDAKQIDQAAGTLARSIALGSDVASARPVRRIRAVAARLQPHAAMPAVRQVLDQVKTIAPAPSPA
jgi:transcriptional regulator with XRE-family HTH domain